MLANYLGKRVLMPMALAAALILIATVTAFAVPAAPGAHELSQPDGTFVKAVKWGDEWAHGYETLDGYTIVKDTASGYWVYAKQDPVRGLAATAVRASQAPPVGTTKHLRPSKEFLTALTERRTAQRERVVPSTGIAQIPVILVNFNDTAFTFTTADFNDLLFGTHPSISTGPGSMKDYYEEVSYGAFSISGKVHNPIVTATHPHDYYGSNDPNTGSDAHPAELVREAVQLADEAGFDFGPYDNNGDGLVDIVAIIHQGRGEEESPNETDIWSHRWNLYSAYYYGDGAGPYQTKSGKWVNDYIIMPEVLGDPSEAYYSISTIGVFTHEFGHALGLPDLYDTDYTSQGIGNWGLMGGGSWTKVNVPGDSPVHMSAWSKSALGWVSPTKVTTTSSVSLPAIETNPTALQILDNPDGVQIRGGGQGEYFLLENRQKVGFDQALPGDGLLIWHIDESMSSNRDDQHRLVDLEEADGKNDLDKTRAQGGNRGDAGDPYPGTANNRLFGDGTNPSSRVYFNNESSGVEVANIGDSAATMTADVRLLVPPTTGEVSATPNYGAPPLEVHFSVAPADTDGQIAKVTWDFGDGSPISNEQSPTHIYTERGSYTATVTVEDNDGLQAISRLTVVVAEPGTVLFVDDDGGNSRDVHFTDAFTAEGIPYVTVTPPVTISPTAPYLVVWNTSDAYPTLTSADRAWLKQYLDAGGRLFLSGHEVLYENDDLGWNDNFVIDYLHVADHNNDVGATMVKGIAGDPITDGVDINLSFPSDFLEWSDEIKPDANAVGILTSDKTGPDFFAALRYAGAYKLVFSAVAFEGIPADGTAPNNMATLTKRIVDWLNQPPAVSVSSPTAGSTIISPGKANIRWTATDPDNAAETLKVTLSYSDDGGATWHEIAKDEANDGSYDWDLANLKGGRYLVQVVAVDSFGKSTAARSQEFTIAKVAGLLNFGPNPAATAVNFYYNMPSTGNVNVYDITGRLVFSKVLPAGSGSFVWSLDTNGGRPVANGLYVIHASTDDGKASEVYRLVVQR